MNIIQTEEVQDTMLVHLDRGHTSRLSRAVSPSDRDYSSLEEEDFGNDIDICSFFIEDPSDRHSDDEDNDVFEIHKGGNDTAPKQTVSYISEIKLVFNYPQTSLPLTTQTTPQVKSTYNRIMMSTPSIDLSFRSELEVYCFDTHLDHNRRKLTHNPGERNYSRRLSSLIKKM